jgi:hypothetical protein
MLRIVRVSGKYQNEHAATGNPAHDAFGPIGSHFDVAGSDPAPDAGRFQLPANSIRNRFVLAGMADKDLGLHMTAERCSRFRRQWLAQNQVAQGVEEL